MTQHFINTIQGYIDNQIPEHQVMLTEVYQCIKKAAPLEATETISYKMPTFRYNGNLIHFALFKNHIGLYPGPDAINYYQDALSTYKCTKGAIQLPLDKPIPKALISKIVKFNVEVQKTKRGPNWHIARGNWEEAEETMAQIIATFTELDKKFKWGTDIYTFQDKNIVAWGGFKNFFSIWFYNGVFLKDSDSVLISASEGKTQGLRQWRFLDVADMDATKIKQYIQEAIAVVASGKTLKPQKAVPVKPAGLLKEALNKDVALLAAFEALTAGKRKDYIEYIDDAKQTVTKERRLEKIKPLIIQGIGLNDKYKSK